MTNEQIAEMQTIQKVLDEIRDFINEKHIFLLQQNFQFIGVTVEMFTDIYEKENV